MIDEPVGYVCPLRPRELEALKLIADGMTAKEAARSMDIAPYTVEHYLVRAKDRLGPRTLPGLVAFAMRKGWIQ